MKITTITLQSHTCSYTFLNLFQYKMHLIHHLICLVLPLLWPNCSISTFTQVQSVFQL